MARNGAGSYSLPAGNPVTTGTTISSTWANNTLSDIATAITQSLAKDGQTTLTANLPMGGFKLTSLAAGSVAGDSARFEQLFSLGALTDIASAATTDIGALLSTMARVTGTTGITSFGTNYNGPRLLVFVGAVTLTHSATLVLPGAANITTAAGDSLITVPISGGWQVVAFQRAANLLNGAAASGANADITSLTALTTAISGTALGNKIQPITASVASNALTITLNPTTLDFRSATLTSGTVNTRQVAAAISVVISSGSTLGTVSAQQSRIAVLAIDNGGTVELAAVNIAGGVGLSETGLISTTAEGGAGAADSATVAYSTTARTSVPYRVVGYVESTQATAGTWATAPSTIQGAGGLIAPSIYQQGAAPVFGARAWCFFNGNTAGTNAPTSGGNVSSVTKNGTGDYTITFTTALPSANFAWSGSASNSSVGAATIGVQEYGAGSKTTTTLRVTVGVGNVLTDEPNVHVIIFG